MIFLAFYFSYSFKENTSGDKLFLTKLLSISEITFHLKKKSSEMKMDICIYIYIYMTKLVSSW